MEFLEGSFADAMRFIAERRLFAEIQKQANDDSSTKAHDARQALGVLGADENAVNAAVSGLRDGSLGESAARKKIKGAVPGSFKQIGNMFQGMSTAGKQGRIGDVAAQLDILGLKQVSPWAENFSPVLAGTSIGAAAIAAERRRAFVRAATRRGMPVTGKTIGRWLPSIAASVPLAIGEWSGRGYRSGNKPAKQLIEATKPGDKK